MKVLSVATLLLLVPMAAGADSARTPEQAAADLGRLIHQAIVAKLPPVIEDSSGWGHTIPLPNRVLLPRLRRTLVPVGERMEVPDGPWRKAGACAWKTPSATCKCASAASSGWKG